MYQLITQIILKNILKPVLFEVLELETNSEGVWLQDGEVILSISSKSRHLPLS